MKVIGEGNGDNFICEVSLSELRKFMNLYFTDMKTLKVGEKIDLSKGYDFLSDAEEALKKTQNFIESNGEIIAAITNGIRVFSNVSKGDDND